MYIYSARLEEIRLANCRKIYRLLRSAADTTEEIYQIRAVEIRSKFLGKRSHRTTNTLDRL